METKDWPTLNILVQVLYKRRNLEISRCGSAQDGKKLYLDSFYCLLKRWFSDFKKENPTIFEAILKQSGERSF